MPTCAATGCNMLGPTGSSYCQVHNYMDTPTEWKRAPDSLVDETGIFDTGDKSEPVSVADDRLDKLIESASIPNLGALFKKGQDSGIIQARQAYE